jgi:hypothetical protein
MGPLRRPQEGMPCFTPAPQSCAARGDHSLPLPKAHLGTAVGPQCVASPWDRHSRGGSSRGLREAEQRSLGLRRLGEPSAAVRMPAEAARERQRAPFVETSLVTNADSAQPPRQGDRLGRDPAAKCPLGILPGRRRGQSVAEGGHTCTWTAGASVQQMHLSARAYHRVLKRSTQRASWGAPLLIWPGRSTSRRRTSPRRFSTGRGDKSDLKGASSRWRTT